MTEAVQRKNETKQKKRSTEEVVEWIHEYYTRLAEFREGKSFRDILDIANDPRSYRKSKTN